MSTTANPATEQKPTPTRTPIDRQSGANVELMMHTLSVLLYAKPTRARIEGESLRDGHHGCMHDGSGC